MNTHMNTKHGDNNCRETLSNFIFRLELEEYAEEYKDHFKRYSYTRGEAQHVEKMIEKYGVDYVLKLVYQKIGPHMDCSSTLFIMLVYSVDHCVEHVSEKYLINK